MTTPMNAGPMALIPLLWFLFVMPLPAIAVTTTVAESITLTTIVSEYDRLQPQVMTLVAEIRDARKAGHAIESGRILLVRKDLGEFIKTLRRYDKNHLRAAKGMRTYPDREKIIRLFHVSDLIHRLLDAETKATDFQMLGYKYEDLWRQADAARAGTQTDER